MGRGALAAVVVALLAGESSLLIAGKLTNIPAWQAHSRWRGDSAHYQSIAEHGYELRHCREDDNHGRPEDWCGNCSWFPGYAGLVALVTRAGAPFEPAAVAVARRSNLVRVGMADAALGDRERHRVDGSCVIRPIAFAH